MKTIYSFISCMFMLICTLSVQAQVKIGTNPTTIGANSNLEVEATNNKKVIVHKNDGTMVIENTPPGSITDSMLSVDAAGNVRSISTARITRPPVYVYEASSSGVLGASQGTRFYLALNVMGSVIPSSAAADNWFNGGWKAPAEGIYRIDLRATATANNNVSGYGIVYLELQTSNQGAIANADVTVSTYGPNANKGTASLYLSRTLRLQAGEIIRAQMASCVGCGPDYYWGLGALTVQRVE